MATRRKKEGKLSSDSPGQVGIVPDRLSQRTAREEAEAARDAALICTSAAAIQVLKEDEAREVQRILQHGDRYGFWQTPSDWKRTEHSAARLCIDLRGRILHFLQKSHNKIYVESLNYEGVTPLTTSHRFTEIMNGAVLVFTRYLLLLRMGPAGIGVKAMNRPLDPTNVLNLAYNYLPPLFAIAVCKLLGAGLDKLSQSDADIESDSGIGYLRQIQQEDLDFLSKDVKQSALREARRMAVLAERGFWNDVPAFWAPLSDITVVAGPVQEFGEEKDIEPSLPLPDEYVSEMGRKSLWLIQDLAPNLLTIAKRILSIWRSTDTPELEPNAVQCRRRAAVESLLKRHVWRDCRGVVIESPPFKIRLAQLGKESRKDELKGPMGDDGQRSERGDGEWPPRGFAQIMGLINNVQLAHLFVVALATGGRRSETLDLKRDCVHYAANGEFYAVGKTFKLVQRYDGRLRDWVLPEMAVYAIEQQVRLVKLTEQIGPMVPVRRLEYTSQAVVARKTHLWAQLAPAPSSKRSARLIGLDTYLRRYAKSLHMDTKPSGQNLTPHRFRKTVARLVALALTQAPKILMDVFGHKSIEMTMYYILTDDDLRVEIEQVSRELRVMRAKEVVQRMFDEERLQEISLPFGGFGGPAAVTINAAVKSHVERLHRRGEDWNAGSAFELAEILTLQGKAWEIVRRGVICTKFPGTEVGLCNKSTGHPEPSRCDGGCNHRLEEGFLREDVDGAIEEALRCYHEAERSGERLIQAHWGGQIRAHVGRFQDLRAKWLENPCVRSLLEQPLSEEDVV